jgi:hypothetical protein
MVLEASRLEEMLVENMRSYLADGKSSDELKAQRLQELCSTLNWFFSALVRGHEKWNRFHWLDGVIALSVEVKPDNEMALDGYIFVGRERRDEFMMEPFSASLQVSETGGVCALIESHVGMQVDHSPQSRTLFHVPRDGKWSPTLGSLRLSHRKTRKGSLGALESLRFLFRLGDGYRFACIADFEPCKTADGNVLAEFADLGRDQL